MNLISTKYLETGLGYSWIILWSARETTDKQPTQLQRDSRSNKDTQRCANSGFAVSISGTSDRIVSRWLSELVLKSWDTLGRCCVEEAIFFGGETHAEDIA
jgi:hypothetical protein